MEEASIRAPRALDLRLQVPTSIEDLEATMKLIHTTTPARHAPREVVAATATRRSINPSPMTFATTSMLAQMSTTASKIAGPHTMKQRWSITNNSMPNMRDLLPIKCHFPPVHQDFAPSWKGFEPSGGLWVSRFLVLTPMMERPTPLSG